MKVRTAAHDFGISVTTLSHYLFKFQEQENFLNTETKMVFKSFQCHIQNLIG